MNKMKNIFLIILILTSIKTNAQEVVHVNVIGKGKTEQEATLNGLRNALTQTSSVFISSNVTVINDELTKDQTSMINNGSIESYKIFNVSRIEDLIVVNLDVNVSVIKLTSFIENKGGTSELKGGLFAANIKLQELNEKAELNATKDLIEVSQSILDKSFDYSITNGEPINKDNKWEVPLEVIISKNKNYENFVSFFYQSLRKIAMKPEDVKTYIKLQKPMRLIGLFDNSSIKFPTQTIHFGLNKKSERLSLLPDDGLRYYVRMKEGKDTLKFITNDKKKAISFETEWYKANINEGASSRGPYACDDRFYISNDSTKLDLLYFRNIETFDMISNFIKNIGVSIMNVKVDNNISSENINSIFEKTRSNTQNLTYSFGKFFEENFLISFGYAYQTDATIYFLPYKPHSLSMCMENYAGSDDGKYYPKFGGNLLRNYKWEKNMWVEYTDFSSKSRYNRILFNEFNKINEIALKSNKGISGYYKGQNLNQLYFDYVFGSYFLFLSNYNKLAYYSNYNYNNIGNSFPLQLSLIGNEKGEVYKFELINKVSTDEISKIKTYTIQR